MFQLSNPASLLVPAPSPPVHSALRFRNTYLLFPLPYIWSDCQSGKARILAAATGHPSRPNAGLRFIVPAHSHARAPTGHPTVINATSRTCELAEPCLPRQ